MGSEYRLKVSNKSQRFLFLIILDAIKLHIKLLCFLYDHEFKILKGGHFQLFWGWFS